MDRPPPRMAASVRGWDVFAAMFFIGLPLGIVSEGWQTRFWVAQVVALAAWYAVVGRLALRGGERRWERVYFVGAGLLLIWGSSSTPGMTWFVLFLLPMAWWLCLPDRRRAMAWSVYIVGANMIGIAGCILWAVGQTWTPFARVLDLIVLPLLLLGLCVIAVTWLDRSFNWGRNRMALSDELQATQEHALEMEREAAAAEERLRLSREIHDTIAQGIVGVRMLTEQARRQADELDDGSPQARALGQTLALIGSAAEDVFAQARELVASLGPVLPGATIASSIERLADRFTHETRVPVTLAVADVPLEGDAAIVALRCVQEGLANIRKHARASRVWLSLRCEGGSALLTLSDNGVGMTAGTTYGFGLTGMAARVEGVGGRLVVEPTGSDSGVRLVVRLPLRDAGGSAVRRGVRARAGAAWRWVRPTPKPVNPDAPAADRPADSASPERGTAGGKQKDQADGGPGAEPPRT